MVLTALSKNFPGPDIKGRKEIDRAMADILKFLAFDQTGPQGQRRVQAFQGLEALRKLTLTSDMIRGRHKAERI